MSVPNIRRQRVRLAAGSPAPPIIREAIAAGLSDQDVSQSELARRTGMRPSAICRYLAGHREVTTGVAERMLAALGLTIGPRAG